MSQMLNITASMGRQDVLPFPGPGPGNGPGNGARDSDAPEGLFSALVSLLSGSGREPLEISSPQAPDAGSNIPGQTGEFWLGLQAGSQSLSLNAQTINQAISQVISQNNATGQIPGLSNGLQIDARTLAQLAVQGAEGVINAATAANGQGQAAAIGTALLNMQETLQNSTPVSPNAQQGQAERQQTQSGLFRLLTGNDQSGLNQPGNARQSAPPALAPASAPTPEQLALRDPLASDLQRQLSTTAELSQSRNALQPAQAINGQGNNPNVQTTSNLAAIMAAGMADNPSPRTSLPFVQTREILTSTDPMMVAQASPQVTSQGDQAALFRPLQAGYQPNPINLPNMAFEIIRNFNAGTNRFQIRLDPPELGRIDVRMKMDEAGNLNARLAVERPETLEFLQRDARALERALAQAGLDDSRTSLEFTLKQDFPGGDHPSGNPDKEEPDHSRDPGDINGSSPPPPDPAMIAAYRGSLSPGGVSIWA